MIDLIYTRSEKLFLAKQTADYTFWQTQLTDYLTHIHFSSIADCADFLQTEYGLSVASASQLISTVFESKNAYFELIFDDTKLIIKEIEKI
ncbi:hypothetical protein [Capnocytophaga sp.]|uniref:hypothetical protein n=1 Tax=Capnocytophaga sp. TaxID=44737 RepID=UPI0026DC89BB|nr:hypothetical protein [Capnocytophaga sp.]MDO5106532.1 hypothetical protein [Capnocytophaga sp.]